MVAIYLLNFQKIDLVTWNIATKVFFPGFIQPEQKQNI